MAKTIKVHDLVTKLKLEVIYAGNEDATISVQDVTIPTAEICGKPEKEKEHRVKIIGTREYHLFMELPKEEQMYVADLIASEGTPCIITSRDRETPQVLTEVAIQRNIPVFKSDFPTSIIIGEIYLLLAHQLNTISQSIHGVLMKIDNIGVLITGESGIGKSEIAAELLQRGHHLVADDRIIAREIYPGHIVGSAPENIRGYLELRGIGIVNIRKIFGESSIVDETQIDLILEINKYDKKNQFDRLGRSLESRKIFATDVDKMIIPVSEGRNAATLIEIAAKHYTLTKRGYSFEEDFLKNLRNGQ